MASYKDFETAATNAGLMSSFDQNDLSLAQKYPEYGLSMVSLKRDAGNATTNEQKLLATEAMNQLRKNYGSYWTGDSGNRGYAASYGSRVGDSMDALANYGEYQSPYAGDIGRTQKSIENYDPYSSPYRNLLDSIAAQISGFPSYDDTWKKEGTGAGSGIAESKQTAWWTDPIGGMSGSAIPSSKVPSGIPNGKSAVSAAGKTAKPAMGTDAYGKAMRTPVGLPENGTGTDYRDQIQELLNEIGNYEAYTSEYRDRINALLDRAENYGSFSYGREGDYQRLLNSVINRKDFSYDPATDPLYSSYRKAYTREGDRAMANALAQAAAASGGRVSSYAQQAASQAGNYYMAQLADMIPQLRNQRYGEYMNDFGMLLQSLGAMDTDRNGEYQRWANGYNQLLSSLAALQGQDATDYGRYVDRLGLLQSQLGTLSERDATDYQRYLDRYNMLLNSGNYLQGLDATGYQRYLDEYNRMNQNLQNLQGLDTTNYGRWQDGQKALQQIINNYLAQDDSDYKRYLDMINAEYQRDRDAVADAQQEVQNALTIYQLTGKIVGPLKDLIGAAAAEPAAGGGGSGGGGGGGGRAPAEEASEKAPAKERIDTSVFAPAASTPQTAKQYQDANAVAQAAAQQAAAAMARQNQGTTYQGNGPRGINR